jgi:hypothetical protein
LNAPRERLPCEQCGAAENEPCRGTCDEDTRAYSTVTGGCPGCGAWPREKHDADCEFFGDKAVAERTRGESNVIELRPPPRDTLGCTFYHGCAPHRRRCNTPAVWLLTFAPDPSTNRQGGFVGFACETCCTEDMRRHHAVAYLSPNLIASLLAGGPRCWSRECTAKVSAWGDFCNACGGRG